MPTITTFVPTPEELAESAREHARSVFPAGSATHTQSTGATAPLHAPPPQAQALPAQRPPRPPLDDCLISSAELAQLHIPPRPALLDRWLCEGDLGFIFAPRGVGKTWMAMALPGAISRGSALGLWAAGDATTGPAPSASAEPPASTAPDSGGDAEAPRGGATPLPVLYVDGEMSLKLTQYRNNGLHLDTSHVTYLHHERMFEVQTHCVNIGEAEDRERLTDVIVRRGYRVLILDNLSSLASGVDENKGTDYEPLSHWLLDLRRRKVTVIVVHHAGRNGMMRGHSKREDACSWILELRDARQESDSGAKFVSHFAKPSRNTGDPLPDLLWHFTTDPATGITDIRCELAVENDYEQFIQHVLEGVTNQKDMAELMNRHKGTVSKWARKALEDGRISGNSHKLLPPRSKDNKPVKSHYHPDEDSGDEDEEDDSF